MAAMMMMFMVVGVVMMMMILLCSIQSAAVWVLEHYYRDFPIHNPNLPNLPKAILSRKMTGFKLYSLEEGEDIHTHTHCAHRHIHTQMQYSAGFD